jgi:hypothetical protein
VSENGCLCQREEGHGGGSRRRGVLMFPTLPILEAQAALPGTRAPTGSRGGSLVPQGILGHGSMAMTLRYAHLAP